MVNPQAIVARGIYIIRDYRGDFRKVETKFVVKAMYVFEPGNTRMIWRSTWLSQSTNEFWTTEWTRGSTIRSLMNIIQIPAYCSFDSIREAVKGTPFQYSMWESYARKFTDMTRFFDLYAHYPCIEYLTKFGLQEVVIAKLEGDKTYGAINWRGKTIQQVLRLKKSDVKAIVSSSIRISPRILRLYQICQKEKSNLTIEEIKQLDKKYGFLFTDLVKILKFTTLRRATQYISKQYQKNYRTNYATESHVFIAWRDYLAECKELDFDLSDEAYLFPSNLKRAHDNTSRQIKILGDKLLDQKIKKRLQTLEAFHFANKKFFLRPAHSTDELVQEGKALKHCVGRYGKDYANGKTIILLIRKVTDPAIPFYTMEVKGTRIVQVYGKGHCLPTSEVKSFIEEFKEAILNKPKSKTRKEVVA